MVKLNEVSRHKPSKPEHLSYRLYYKLFSSNATKRNKSLTIFVNYIHHSKTCIVKHVRGKTEASDFIRMLYK